METASFSGWKVRAIAWVLRVAMVPLMQLLDWVLSVLFGESWGVYAVRRFVTAGRIRRTAMRLAGVAEEVYHVPSSEIEERLNRAIDAVARVDEGSELAGCGHDGRELCLGILGILALERRLVRQLVVDLLVTRTPKRTAVVRPVFIVGPPRSGTTALLELLGHDSKRWRQLKTYEAVLPVPTKSAALSVAAHGWLGGVQFAMESIKHIHYESWDGPTECRTALENGLGAPYIFWYIFGATRALELWKHQDSDYAFYKTQLEVLQDDSMRCWLLKDPGHCFSLDALLAAFPDASIVWTHRDPRKVVASMCSLEKCLWNALLRKRKAETSDGPPAWGTKVLDVLARMLGNAVRYRIEHPEAKILDVHADDLLRDPMAQVRRIYDFAGFPLTQTAQQEMQKCIDANAKQRRGKSHTYDLRDFGISSADVDIALASYSALPVFQNRGG